MTIHYRHRYHLQISISRTLWQNMMFTADTDFGQHISRDRIIVGRVSDGAPIEAMSTMKRKGSSVSGVAVVSAIFGAEDIEKATTLLKERVRAMVEE